MFYYQKCNTRRNFLLCSHETKGIIFRKCITHGEEYVKRTRSRFGMNPFIYYKNVKCSAFSTLPKLVQYILRFISTLSKTKLNGYFLPISYYWKLMSVPRLTLICQKYYIFYQSCNRTQRSKHTRVSEGLFWV